MTKASNNDQPEKARVPPSTQQDRDAVSEDVASLDKPAFKLTNNQVKEAVIEALTSLESKAIKWSEMLDVMSNLAFQRGDPELANLMEEISQKLWEAENTQK